MLAGMLVILTIDWANCPVVILLASSAGTLPARIELKTVVPPYNWLSSVLYVVVNTRFAKSVVKFVTMLWANWPDIILLASKPGICVAPSTPVTMLAGMLVRLTIDCANCPVVILLASRPGICAAPRTPVMMLAAMLVMLTIDCANWPEVILLASRPGMFIAGISLVAGLIGASNEVGLIIVLMKFVTAVTGSNPPCESVGLPSMPIKSVKYWPATAPVPTPGGTPTDCRIWLYTFCDWLVSRTSKS